jgi:phage baseplate assembly protein W
MNVDFPFRYDTRGRTAGTDEDDHLRDLVYQVLFTAPGERVNRPTFGSGLMQLVFAPNSDTLAAATQLVVRSALQQWLGDLLEVEDILVESADSTLAVTVVYTNRRTQEREIVQFTNPGAPL